MGERSLLANAFLLLVATGVALGQKEHVTCDRTFNKIGCFKQRSIVTTLLVNDREEGSEKHQGHKITWTEIVQYLHSLACRCAVEAKKHNFQYFGITYYGLCYGGNVDEITDDMKSSDCFQGMSYGPCSDDNEEECGGKESAEYIYAMITATDRNIDGGYSDWSSWSACTVECGGGIMSRARACINPPPKGNGKDCSALGNDTEIIECGLRSCPVDGGFTEWSLFGSCSKSCGGGVMKRIRNCSNPEPVHGGKDCVGPTEETQNCSTEACPVHGGFTEWTSFGPCSVTCGKGVHQRERFCTNPLPANGGDDCEGAYKESAECDAGGCPVDGGYGEWEVAGECSKSCGGGELLYTRKCDNPRPENGGANCSSIGPDREMRECNKQPCAIDGGLSEWSEFGNCSVTCGVGFKYRTRECNNPAPQHGGRDCEGELRETEDCTVEHCKGNIAYKKDTKQSSTGFEGASSKATDGNRNSNYHGLSCTHTHRERNPWWRVDLGRRHVVGNIKITNRGDCCSDRLRNVEVRIGDEDTPTGNPICTYFAGIIGNGERKTLSCPIPMIGRFVYVSLRAVEWLTLCEVEVYSPNPANLARGKPTKQTSIGWNGPSSKAVDGDIAANYGHGSCTHTHKEQNPWWRVDLGKSEPVGKVVLTNRGDCCSQRLRNVEVKVGNIDNSLQGNDVCAYHHGSLGAGQRKVFYCRKIIKGRFVYVTLKAEEYLTLCEVEVYRANIDNFARGRPTSQSSTKYNGLSSKAVDGNENADYFSSSCTCTNKEIGAWWRVNLESEKTVGKIIIVNRADCCSNRLKNFEIRVGNVDSSMANAICHVREAALRPGVKSELFCSKPIRGKYVFIRLRGTDYLTLCEVEVYGLKDGEKVDGGFSEWSPFSSCSVSCGGGVKYSTRTCTNPYPGNGGASCVGPTKKNATCNTHKCPVDGGLSLWSSWGACLTRCGGGTQYRRRLCNNPPPQHGGKPCEGSLVESRHCEARPCPIDGGYGPWTPYAACSVTCGRGHRVRTRKCNNPSPAHGGRSCARLGPSVKRRICRLSRCPMPISPLFYRRVCQHGAIYIICPIGSHIRIQSAMYGRKNKVYCRRGWWNTISNNNNCVARQSRDKVSNHCNNRRKCHVPAKNWFFGRTCVNTFKYLEIKYRCYGSSAQSFHTTVCEGSTKSIQCPLGRRINITRAMYGRLNKKICPLNNHTSTNQCKSRSSLKKTKEICDGKMSSVLSANNNIYGDPCVSVYKYLQIRYRCVW